MGRRINISQPTVINTELVPLTDSFALEPNGQTEQWYYENDGTYAPDRRIVPLVITPKLSAFDKDTNQTYTPNISTIAWYDSQWINGKWVDAEITNISDASQDYYIRQDKALQVSKNLSDAAHGITIRCIATFIDPRDAGITYTEEDTMQLTANKDATVFYPEVDILNETTVTFNPLVDENSHKVFKGKIDWTSITRLNPNIAEYYANPSGTEQMLPDNATDVTSLSPILDIRYGRESIVSWNQLFTYRQTADGTLAGNERTVTWNQLVQNGDFSDGLTGWSVDSEYAQYVSISQGKLKIDLTSPRTVLVTHQGTSDYVTAGHKYYLSFTCFVAGLYTCKIGVSDFIVSLNGSSADGRHSAVGYPTISSLPDKYVTIEAKTTLGFVYVNIDDIMLVDLTLMYGEGHEPATSAQFEADFKSIFERELEEYQPFNTGETIVISSILDRTASVRRIQGQSVVWNQKIENPELKNNAQFWTTSGGVTLSYNGSIIEVSNLNGSTYLASQVKTYDGHKYYVTLAAAYSGVETTSAIATMFSFAVGGNTQQIINNIVPDGTIRRYSKIIQKVGSNSVASFTTYPAPTGMKLLIDTNYGINVIDLTLMFGAGNEPATVEEFEAWLAANVGLRDYYPYDGGTILGVKSTGIKTTGFNQWDEEWVNRQINSSNGQYNNTARVSAKNFIKIVPDTTYHFYCSKQTSGDNIIVDLFFYTNLGKYIGYQSAKRNQDFTPPEGAAFMKFTLYGGYYGQTASNTYNHDVCINISDPNKNGTYEPYQEYTCPMLGTIDMRPNGHLIFTDTGETMYGLPSAKDEIKVEDGKIYGISQLLLIPMSLMAGNVIYDSAAAEFKAAMPLPLYVNEDPVGTIYMDILCSKYATSPVSTYDKSCFVRKTSSSGYYEFCFKDSSFSTVADFEASLTLNDTILAIMVGNDFQELVSRDTTTYEWYGVKNNAEVKIDTLPCYVSGQGTDTLTIDAMFGENIPVVLRAKRYPWSDSLYPSKAYRNMTWRVPNIDAIVASDRGQAVHSDNDGGYEFDTIINIKKAILDEETKNKHLRFKWWMRNTRNNQAVETSVGWGSQVGIGVEDLRNVRGANNSLASTPVYNEVMLLGAYEEVSYTSGNATEYVTYNGVQLFGRTLE